MSSLTLIWLFPIVFMLHDFEEIILMRAWAARLGEADLLRIPARLRSEVEAAGKRSTARFAAEVAFLFLVISLSTLLAAEAGWLIPFEVLAVGFTAHALLHLVSSLRLRRFTPGVVTALVLALPYGGLLIRRLLVEGWMQTGLIWISLPLSLLLFALLIPALHNLADRLPGF